MRRCRVLQKSPFWVTLAVDEIRLWLGRAGPRRGVRRRVYRQPDSSRRSPSPQHCDGSLPLRRRRLGLTRFYARRDRSVHRQLRRCELLCSTPGNDRLLLRWRQIPAPRSARSVRLRASNVDAPGKSCRHRRRQLYKGVRSTFSPQTSGAAEDVAVRVAGGRAEFRGLHRGVHHTANLASVAHT